MVNQSNRDSGELMKISIGSSYNYNLEVSRIVRDFQEKLYPAGAFVYASKYEEAKSWPDSDSIILKRESEELGIPIEEVVDSVLNAHNRWKNFTSKVDCKRMITNKRLKEADSNLEKDRIVKSFEAFCTQTYQEFLEE